jgi:hypothetical protein
MPVHHELSKSGLPNVALRNAKLPKEDLGASRSIEVKKTKAHLGSTQPSPGMAKGTSSACNGNTLN